MRTYKIETHLYTNMRAYTHVHTFIQRYLHIQAHTRRQAHTKPSGKRSTCPLRSPGRDQPARNAARKQPGAFGARWYLRSKVFKCVVIHAYCVLLKKK